MAVIVYNLDDANVKTQYNKKRIEKFLDDDTFFLYKKLDTRNHFHWFRLCIHHPDSQNLPGYPLCWWYFLHRKLFMGDNFIAFHFRNVVVEPIS